MRLVFPQPSISRNTPIIIGESLRQGLAHIMLLRAETLAFDNHDASMPVRCDRLSGERRLIEIMESCKLSRCNTLEYARFGDDKRV